MVTAGKGVLAPGTLHVLLSVRCHDCSLFLTLAGDALTQAADSLARRGWHQRDGAWRCPACATRDKRSSEA